MLKYKGWKANYKRKTNTTNTKPTTNNKKKQTKQPK